MCVSHGRYVYVVYGVSMGNSKTTSLLVRVLYTLENVSSLVSTLA